MCKATRGGSQNDIIVLRDKCPEAAAVLADQSLADTIGGSSKRVVECICKCGSRFSRPVNHLVKSESSRDCGNQKAGRVCILNSLSRVRPDIAARVARPEDAERLRPMSAVSIEWNCDCGNTFFREVRRVVLGSKGCGHIGADGKLVICPMQERRIRQSKDAADRKRAKRRLSRAMIGKRFGLLTVRKEEPRPDVGVHKRYTCDCDCGVTVTGLRSCDLRSGSTSSCGCLGASQMEEWAGNTLSEIGVPYNAEHTFDDCRDINLLRFDFAILDEGGNVRCLIELDGEQHSSWRSQWAKADEEKKARFSDRLRKDSIKTLYAWDNKIPLIRISYQERGFTNDDHARGEWFKTRLLTELHALGIITLDTFQQHHKPWEPVLDKTNLLASATAM